MTNPDKIINRVLYGVDAVVFHPNGHVLMLNRDPTRESFETGWEFIKGGLKESESYLDAAKREIEEEAGIEVLYIGELSQEFHIDARYRNKPNYDYVHKKALVFLYKSGDIQIDESEHTGWRWMPFEDAISAVWVDNGADILLEAREVLTHWNAVPNDQKDCDK